MWTDVTNNKERNEFRAQKQNDKHTVKFKTQTNYVLLVQ